MERDAVTAGDSDGVAASRAPWLDVGAFAAALLAYATCHGGLFFAGYAPAIQVGIVVGLVASLVATRPWRAATVAAAAGIIGPIFEMPLTEKSYTGAVFAGGSLPMTIASVAIVGALVAFGAAWLVRRGMLRPGVVVALGAALLIANLWLTTSVLLPGRQVVDGRTLSEFLTTPPKPNTKQADQAYYVAVASYMKRDGLSYYQAVKRAYNENTVWGYNPPNVLAVREPLLFYVWTLFADLRGAVWAMVALASAAGALALAVPRGLSRPTARLIATGGVVSYLLYFTTLPYVLGFEPWGGALAVVCAGLFALAIGATPAGLGTPDAPVDDAQHVRRRLLMASAALVAFIAVACRELMLFLPAAGLAAALFSPKRERRFDLAVWIGALVAAVSAWAMHACAAQSIITPRSGLEKWAFRGNLETLVMGVTHGSQQLSAQGWIMVTLAVLGVIGAAVQAERQYRVFALVALGLPLVFFVFAWNGAIDITTGAKVNYWGSIVNPLLLAFVPAALLLIPGMRATATAAETAGIAQTAPQTAEADGAAA